MLILFILGSKDNEKNGNSQTCQLKNLQTKWFANYFFCIFVT